MKTLRQIITNAANRGVAVGHFNVAETSVLKAVFESAKKLGVPVIIGTSEGEAGFLGRKQAAALVRSLREEYKFPIFINSDHTHSFEEVKKAVAAGYDAILFDGGKLPLAENIRQTKKVVQYVKSKNKNILVEGELGNIGSGSTIRKEFPKGAAIKPEDLTKPEEALKFVKATGVDLLAPAVGNIHGMFKNAPEPALDIERIRAIKKAVKIPLVLHGGSGNTNKDFKAAIKAGISIIHISTELRVAWRKGLERGLRENREELAPYKILAEAVAEVEKVVYTKLRLFN
ncbi:MAG: class II fructose-bisphosphate aldolase [bacterium]|nr:class II fructose-bisphosphate aldolase [bacterium]